MTHEYLKTPKIDTSTVQHRVFLVMNPLVAINSSDVYDILLQRNLLAPTTDKGAISQAFTQLRRDGLITPDPRTYRTMNPSYFRVKNPNKPNSPQLILSYEKTDRGKDIVRGRYGLLTAAGLGVPEVATIEQQQQQLPIPSDKPVLTGRHGDVSALAEGITTDIETLVTLCCKVNLAEVTTADMLTELQRRDTSA
jgi:hypothetical protein